jgi:putative peptidoglycan binding protein
VKTKRLVWISCLTAAAALAAPALGAPHKKSVATSQARPQRMAARSNQSMTAHSRNTGSVVGTQRYAATRQYTGTRHFAGRSYGTTGYYSGSRYYYGGPSYSYGGGYPYYGGSYSYWPGTSYGYYPYSYYGGGYYPYSYYGSYPAGYTGYSYYQPAYGYNSATVAAVQQRLGELGYYHGAIDGIMGPQTRAAIAAYEGRHGMTVDGMITPRFVNDIGIG